MTAKLKVGILKETKNPPDRRAAIAPTQAFELVKNFPDVDLFVQSSKLRTFDDKEYTDLGINVVDNLENCDILIGVKEVKKEALIPNKKYLFFSHTAKKQAFNRTLLQEILKKNITLIDYEYLTNEKGARLVAFGRWAGFVGAYNALIAYGKRTGLYDIKRACDCHDFDEFFTELKKVKLPPVKILITGGGRVAHGAMETLAPLILKKVTPAEFVSKDFDEAVYCQIDPWHYTRRKDGEPFNMEHFIKHPELYENTFEPFSKAADILISCHFWDPKSPRFFTSEEMTKPEFKIKVIADVSCDIGGAIPSTVKASTIANPFYGYNPKTEEEGEPFDKENVTVMAVDNLPGEAPRNASEDFGKKLNHLIFPSLFGDDKEQIIERATIAKDGNLTKKYEYLQRFVDGYE